MEIKEFAFREGDTAITKGPETMVLECKDCGITEYQPRVDPYSGHMYEQCVTYTCSVCRGNMTIMNINNNEKEEN